MIIRHVISKDSQAWKQMREALWPGDPHVAEIAAFFAGELAEPEAVLIAEHRSNVLVAMVELSIRHDLPGTRGAATGYIEGLYIVPEHRNTGLARQLLRAARYWARERRCTFFASDRAERVIFDSAYQWD